VHEIGIGEVIAQEARAGPEPRPAEGLRDDVEILDLEQIARLCVLDPDRPGQGMARLLVLPLEIGGGRLGSDLPIARVTCLEDQLLTGCDLEDRRDVGVPAVVAGMRLVLEAFRAVDPDLFDRSLL
jgi:hypothetical protein